jgi:hypothetical protein
MASLAIQLSIGNAIGEPLKIIEKSVFGTRAKAVNGVKIMMPPP